MQQLNPAQQIAVREINRFALASRGMKVNAEGVPSLKMHLHVLRHLSQSDLREHLVPDAMEMLNLRSGASEAKEQRGGRAINAFDASLPLGTSDLSTPPQLVAEAEVVNEPPQETYKEGPIEEERLSKVSSELAPSPSIEDVSVTEERTSEETSDSQVVRVSSETAPVTKSQRRKK